MRWRTAWLTASSCALVLAGCGGGERLPVLTALRLAELADRRDCAGLIRASIDAVNRHEVPPALQEQLLSEANACRFPRAFRP